MFALKTDGTGFRILHTFAASASPNYINSDGVHPTGDLTLSGDILFGTTSAGGGAGNGTVFKVGTDGTAFTTLHTFSLTSSTNSSGSYTNSDGVEPYAGLILSGNSLYGTALAGGSGGGGTVFMLNADGTGFRVLHTFTSDFSNYDGAQSWAGLILSGNSLYGAAYYGGSSGSGTVFSLSLQPQLTLIHSKTNLILTWPTNYAGFDYTRYVLQSSTNFGSSASWTINSTAPVAVNGQNIVTNPISGRQQFFRLSR